MSGTAFLDTHVLIYTLGQREDRTPSAEALLADSGGPDVTAALAEIKISTS
jgi:hypothetical protein